MELITLVPLNRKESQSYTQRKITVLHDKILGRPMGKRDRKTENLRRTKT